MHLALSGENMDKKAREGFREREKEFSDHIQGKSEAISSLYSEIFIFHFEYPFLIANSLFFQYSTNLASIN